MQKNQGTEQMRTVSGAHAVIVKNAFLDTVGPLSGSFEIQDPNCSMRMQEDGQVRITVNCHFLEEGVPGSTLVMRASPWDCLAVLGYHGSVIAAIART